MFFQNLTKKQIIIFSVVSLLMVILSIILLSFNNSRKNHDLLMSNLKADIKDNEKILSDEEESLKPIYSEANLKKYLSDVELKNIEKSFWSYNLSLNGTEIREKNISVKLGSVKLIFTENKKPRIIPKKLYDLGSLQYEDNSEFFYDHIRINENIKYTVSTKSEYLKNTAVFDFGNITSGTTFKIDITESLKKRINLAFTDITVKVQ